MANSALSYPGNGVSFVPGTQVPVNGAVVVNGGTATLAKSDNTGNLGTVTLNVSGGSIQDVALPANKAVLTDQQASININQFDSTGSFAASVAVALNVQTVTLANATTRIAANGGPVNVTNSASSKTVGAAFQIAGGAWGAVQLSAATDAIVSNAGGVAVRGQPGTLAVAGGLLTQVTLPATVAVVQSGDALTIPVTGTYVTTVTLTISGGLITSMVLS